MTAPDAGSPNENSLDSWIADEPASPLAYLPGQQPASSDSATGSAAKLCSEELVISLAAKPFVILTGPSGTGKSRSGLQLAQAIAPAASPRATYRLIPVGADWTDGRHLLGFKNPFGKERELANGDKTHETYEITDTLRLLLAAAHPDRLEIPHFLILDEMNLSHVERYFSAFLSLLEANRALVGEDPLPLLDSATLSLISDVLQENEPGTIHGAAAAALVARAQGLPLSPNVFVIGTVNVDETTYMFSPKVLDRAHVLELNSVPPNVYLSGADDEEIGIEAGGALTILRDAINRQPGEFARATRPKLLSAVAGDLGIDAAETQKIEDALKGLLNGAYKLLEPLGFGFGFRVVNETYDYIIAWLRARYTIADGDPSFFNGWQDALDRAFLQKLLPKIHGNRRQLGDSLLAIRAFLEGNDKSGTPPAKYRIGDAPEIAIEPSEILSLEADNQMELSREKLSRMARRLVATGYVTFVE
jgi:energy-coupling factor transporter ATP-binding protein EcfA2